MSSFLKVYPNTHKRKKLLPDIAQILISWSLKANIVPQISWFEFRTELKVTPTRAKTVIIILTFAYHLFKSFNIVRYTLYLPPRIIYNFLYMLLIKRAVLKYISFAADIKLFISLNYTLTSDVLLLISLIKFDNPPTSNK